MIKNLGTRPLLAPVLALALLVSGCAPTPDSPEPVPEEPTTTAHTQSPEEPEAEPELESAPPEEPTVEEEPPEEVQPSPLECVMGIWKVDNQHFSAVVESMGLLPGSFDVEGDLVYNFLGGGTYFEIKDAFTLLTSMEGHAIRNVTTGSTTGSYAVEEEHIYFFDSIDVFHETHHEIPGIGRVDLATDASPEISLYDISVTAPEKMEYKVYDGAAAYECSEDELRLTVDGHTSVWHPSKMPELDGWKP